MIYISTSCLKERNIKTAVQLLADNGYRNIELSGGTEYYEGIENDLIELKHKYNLSFLLHNYFPPPQKPFVLNLASLNAELFDLTLRHFASALKLSEVLGADKYGLHAGFLIDPSYMLLGKTIERSKLADRNKSIQKFAEGYTTVGKACKNVRLYIENNVLSASNYDKFGADPFLLTDYAGYIELKNIIDFDLLLDLAHLKVSCATKALSFEAEVDKLLPLSDYIHISDNDGKSDLNYAVKKGSNLLEVLKKHDCKDKIITLEVYGDMGVIEQSHSCIKDIMNDEE